MATIRSVSDIKRAQKESLLLRCISQLYHQTAYDDSDLQKVFITRVQLSPSKTLCTVYFYTPEGEEVFKQVLKKIVLYKPSMRKALAQEINSRHTCELAFRFDKSFEKAQKMEQLFNSISTTESPDDEE